MKLYHELAEWWPLFSPPGEDYAAEADFVRQLFEANADGPVRSVLELGSGGGNVASYLKAHYALTLVEPSHDMRDVSRALNPECEHRAGDMRSVRLDRRFDAVFVHDAVMYMTSEADLALAITTAGVHCRPGGVTVFAPDCTRETFRPGTDDGGGEGGGRAVRYLEWTHDADPIGTTVTVDYAILLREANGAVRVVHDRHVEGLFPRATWRACLDAAGFEVSIVADPWGRDLFVGRRREEKG